MRLRVDVASEVGENFDKMSSGVAWRDVAWRGVAWRVAHALPMVGFFTATIFGFHVSPEK